ncbi:deoxynucleotide monophosphate kinase family protein [Streptomyces sp. NPDC002346]
MGNIGIVGRARVGKDTAGAWLVDNRGYRRIGFADALKDAALTLDPIVGTHWEGDQLVHDRLARVVRNLGWERAKELREVRRTLQELGMAIRAIDPEFWLRAALKKVTEANEAGVPAVITDVRFPNEADALRRAGFHLVYIDRPGVPQLDHASEGALRAEDADYAFINDGDIPKLHAYMVCITDSIYAAESRRHYARSLS